MRLIQRFIARHPWQTLLLIVLLILAGAADGIGISALLPLLNLTMSSQADVAGEDSLSRSFREAFDYIGLTPTLGIMLLVLISGICIKNLFLFFTEQRTGYIAASITTELRMRLLSAITSSQWR
jgi:ATP-binding cassette subfamily C protein